MAKVSLEQFLEEMVNLIDKRLKKQEEKIRIIEKKIDSKGVDRAVMKVLEGEND